MAKVQGPMFSLEASGKLGGAVVFSSWKGRSYVRSLVKPANPKSGGQVGVRAMFKYLSQQWSGISAGNKATWEDRAEQKIVSPFNAYMSYNQFRWRDFLAPSQHDPADTADTASVTGTLAAAAGVRSITVTQPITTANDGWGIAFFRDVSGVAVTAFDNLIGVAPIDGTNDVLWVDTPLDPGTWYYWTRSITIDGQLGAEVGPVNDTVT